MFNTTDSSRYYEPYLGTVVAASFESNQLSTETKQYLNSVTDEGLSAKVFVPSSGRYYTSAWYTSSTGSLDKDTFYYGSLGFHPHIEVNINF